MNRLFFLWFFFPLVLEGQDLRFIRIDAEHGKPIGKINAIDQDPHGFMWFLGTGERCLYKYDGWRITRYSQENQNLNTLGGTDLAALHVDDSGIVWIGFNKSGLDLFDPLTETFTHYRHKINDSTSLSSDNVTAILTDRQGRLWVGTDDGLNRLDAYTGKFIRYRHDSINLKTISNNHIRALYEDRQGTLWVGTGWPHFNPDPYGGLNRLESDGSFTQFVHDPKDEYSLINNKVRSIFEDSRGQFWVGTSGDGLHTMDRKTGKFTRHRYDPHHPEALSRPALKTEEFQNKNDQVSFINEDINGEIWLGTLFSGISRYSLQTKKMIRYESSNGFPDKSGFTGFQSSDGSMWIGTQENNLFRVDPFKKEIKSIHSNSVNRIYEDEKGDIWMGIAGELLQYDKNLKLIGNYKLHLPLNNFQYSSVHAICRGGPNELWLGTNDGALIFNTTTKQFSRFSGFGDYLGADARQVLSIVHKKAGTTWFATFNGAVEINFESGTVHRYQHDPVDTGSIGSNEIIIIAIDFAGEIWIGTFFGGLSRLNNQNKQFKQYLKGALITYLYEDTGHTLWIGTSAGLYQYDRTTDTVVRFLSKESAFSNTRIYGLVEDVNKALWITTPESIIKLNPRRDQYLVYGEAFGIGQNMIYPGAIFRSRAGKIFVGREDGCFVFHPDDLLLKSPPLIIMLSEFMVNNTPVKPGPQSPLTEPIETAQEIHLSYDQNNIAFHFAAADYRAPEYMRYYTMLENYDDTWREAIGDKSAYYYFLPPGKYQFRIKVSNRDGGLEERKVDIRINPPWWKTWWAYSIYFLLVIAGIVEIFRIQKSRIVRREKLKTQAKELEQAKEIEKAYHELKITQDQLIQAEKMASLGELTSGIAHEIKNPLNFINNFSEINMELISEIEEDQNTETPGTNPGPLNQIIKNLKKNSEKINHHGRRIDGIVKGMLQHSRLGNQNKEAVNINNLCEESLKLAYHGFRSKEKAFNARYETHFEADLPGVWVIPQDMGRVLLNLIDNAFYAVSERLKTVSASASHQVLKPDMTMNNAEMNSALQTKRESVPADPVFHPLVSVRTRKIDENISITISDNGTGIPPSIISKIFQPFFTTKPTGEGTGLGLSMAYDIITKGHSGELLVKSSNGNGTEFEIILPITSPV